MAYRIMSGVQDPPSRYTGKDGDYYVNTLSWNLYGPKVSGRWPAGKPIWPNGMVPRPAVNTADDKPLLAGSGVSLATDKGATLAGDMPSPR